MNVDRKYHIKNLTLLFILSFPLFSLSQEYCEKEWNSEINDSVVNIPDKSAEYKGGEAKMYKYLHDNISLQSDSCKIDSKIQFKYYVKFVIDKKGEVIHAKHLRPSNCIDIDGRILEVINSMEWNPGTCEGNPVNSYFVLPIKIEWH